LAWRIEYTQGAKRDLARLDKTQAKRISTYLRERVAGGQSPKDLGKPLRGVLREFWRYRVGDYRVLCRLEDDRLVVLVVRVGHRKDVYNRDTSS
jgi:mRNA interferase RelE/StbE